MHSLDCHNVFQRGFALVRDRLKHRLYPTVSAFSTDLQSVLQSPPDNPQTGFDIQVKNYVPPHIPLPETPAGRHDAGSIGRKIMHSLRGVLESAAAREKTMHEMMQGPPAKRPRLLDEIALGGVCRNTDGGNDIRISPSVQLVREPSPETSNTSAPSCGGGGGGGRTVLATVSRKLAKGMLAVSGDKERPPWFVEDYRPREAAEASNGPLIVGNAAPSNRQSCSPSPSPAASRLTPGPGESMNESAPTTTLSITSTSTSATSTTTTTTTTTTTSTTTSTASTASTALEETHVAEVDAMDEDMEDAPGEVDDEFLPTASAGHSLEAHPGPEPERLSTLHSDLHDEDAEGDLDDELDVSYPSAPPAAAAAATAAAAAVNPVPVRATLPDLDSAHEDDLLGGYRPEDLPSPLGTVTGDSSSPTGTATHKTQLLDVQDFAHPASIANRGPAVDLPDPPPNRTTTTAEGAGGGGGGMDLENLTNTSVLSDYPDDLDENGEFDMDVVPDADEVCRETTTPPSKRGRGTVGHHRREPNGRFGRGGSRRRRRS